MSFLRDLERRIDERLRSVFRGQAIPGQGRELVEVQRLILDRIDDKVQMLPRARRAFPFNEVTVRIPVPNPEARAAYELVFVADGALQEEVLQHLGREQVETPSDLRVLVSLVETPDVAEPSVVCRNREAAQVAENSQSATCLFHLPSGATIASSKQRIHLGRISDVLDERKRLVRRNDVVVDGDTVSRAHAHIEFADGEFRLFDDGSSYGTSAIRGGRLTDVPRAGGRGLRISSGDEIYLGQARILFEWR